MNYGNKIIQYEKQLLRHFRIAFNKEIMVIKNKKYPVNNIQKWESFRNTQQKLYKLLFMPRFQYCLTLFSLFIIIWMQNFNKIYHSSVL